MQPKAARNISIEALRLVAVAGIAIFHTFQWAFQAACTGAVEYAPLAAFPYSGVLGFINLLGCSAMLPTAWVRAERAPWAVDHS